MSSDADSEMSVELQDLVAKERAEWTNTNPQSTLRQRKGVSRTVLDEVRSCGVVTKSCALNQSPVQRLRAVRANIPHATDYTIFCSPLTDVH